MPNRRCALPRWRCFATVSLFHERQVNMGTKNGTRGGSATQEAPKPRPAQRMRYGRLQTEGKPVQDARASHLKDLCIISSPPIYTVPDYIMLAPQWNLARWRAVGWPALKSGTILVQDIADGPICLVLAR